MTKRVKLDPSASVRINELELAIRRLVSARTGGVAVLGLSEFASELGRSNAATRNSLRSLDKKGLLSVRARFLKNGGQLENEYELTESGRHILKLARNQG